MKCKHCGAEFTPNKRAPHQRFCCKKCCDAAYRIVYYATHRDEIKLRRMKRTITKEVNSHEDND